MYKYFINLLNQENRKIVFGNRVLTALEKRQVHFVLSQDPTIYQNTSIYTDEEDILIDILGEKGIISPKKEL